MRVAIFLLAVAGLMACGKKAPETEPTQAEVVPAALTYDGADAKDRAALLAHGERMGTILGCKQCHGETLQGQNVTANEPEYGDMWAPNISLLLASYSDADLDQVIRHGVPKDKREFWFMPSESFQYVSDADLAALIAWLRTVKPGGKAMPPIRRGPLFDKMVAAGEGGPAPQMIARFRKAEPVDLGEQNALGRYIAKTVCSECHNSEL
jgi:mono/diheme cytochrome c family protein